MTIRDITNRLNLAVAMSTDDRLQLLVIVNGIVEDITLDSDPSFLINARWYVKFIVFK